MILVFINIVQCVVQIFNIILVILFQHGAVVNVADLWKFTPLHEASAKGKFEICRLLLKVGQIQCSVVVFERVVGAVNLLQMVAMSAYRFPSYQP